MQNEKIGKIYIDKESEILCIRSDSQKIKRYKKIQKDIYHVCDNMNDEYHVRFQNNFLTIKNGIVTTYYEIYKSNILSMLKFTRWLFDFKTYFFDMH